MLGINRYPPDGDEWQLIDYEELPGGAVRVTQLRRGLTEAQARCLYGAVKAVLESDIPSPPPEAALPDGLVTPDKWRLFEYVLHDGCVTIEYYLEYLRENVVKIRVAGADGGVQETTWLPMMALFAFTDVVRPQLERFVDDVRAQILKAKENGSAGSDHSPAGSGQRTDQDRRNGRSGPADGG